VPFAPGSCLAAGPDLLDPNVLHTVVRIGQHGAGGAYGLGLSRLSKHTTDDVLDDCLALGRSRVPISLGGPVYGSRAWPDSRGGLSGHAATEPISSPAPRPMCP
jgi:putative AlgH/UPF0301 family transcriptional regulator